MGVLDDLDLPSLQDRPRCAKPKYEMTPGVVAKQEKKQTKLAKEAAFRKGVWERDKHKSRASGKPLSKSGTDWDRVGEVHHVLARSTNPDRLTDVTIGVLLSKHEHQLAETACPGDPQHCFLDIEGPEDMAELHTFIFRDRDGNETRRYQS